MYKKQIKRLAYASLIILLLSFFWVAYSEKISLPNPTDKQIKKETINNTQLQVSRPSTLLGFDWSLPKKTVFEKNSGFIAEYDGDPAYIRHKFIMARWDKLNPAKNKYDFSSLDQQLRDIKSKKVLIRLEVYSACETPKWALKSLQQTNKKSLVYWDKSYQELLAPFIQAFAKRYAANSQIIGVQLGIGDGEYKGACKNFSNKEGWGEFWMTPEELTEAEIKFGLTPQLFEKRTKEIINIYAKAFKGNTGKLAFTNAEPYFSWTKRADPYNKIMLKLADYVHAKGIGNRDGQVENWMRYVDQSFGMKFETVNDKDKTCRLSMDETFAKQIKGRYWGTENEFYGNEQYILESEGPYSNQAYRFFVSSLRALQMRRNYITINGEAMIKIDDPVYKTQDFLHYLNKTLGKQKSNTPDVFVLLGERYIQKERVKDHPKITCLDKDKITVRSFGRWLKESSYSQPSMKINMPKTENYWGQGVYLPDGVDYEYAARSAHFFGFDINNELADIRCNKKTCTVDVKITFKDTVKTSIQVRVEEGVTKTIQTQGDGKIKTVTFPVKSMFRNKAQGFDFIIETKKEALPLILIRMNFLS